MPATLFCPAVFTAAAISLLALLVARDGAAAAPQPIGAGISAGADASQHEASALSSEDATVPRLAVAFDRACGDACVAGDFFTSPPTDEARAAAMPCGEVCVALARALDAKGQCGEAAAAGCQMVFLPRCEGGACDEVHSEHVVGVILYPGAAVDPRSYAPLARVLADEYGLPAVVPIFAEDLASDCDGSRAVLAAAALPDVKAWVVAGHSLGGDAAAEALRAWLSQGESRLVSSAVNVRGLALLGSYLPTQPSCGLPPLDLSRVALPTAIVEATNDMIVNRTRLAAGAHLLPPAAHVLKINITGGNHSQFGSYDPSGRPGPLGPDGNATIPEVVQRGLSASAIADVAARAAAAARIASA